MVVSQNFQLLREATIEADGTLHLGANAVAQRYRILINANGQLLLDPISPIEDEEQWLWQNPDAIAMVQTGISQAAQGKTHSLGSFAQYANLDIDDE
jgi:hypothetical protein